MSFDAKISVIATSGMGKTTLISAILNEIDLIFNHVGLDLIGIDEKNNRLIKDLKDSLNQTINYATISGEWSMPILTASAPMSWKTASSCWARNSGAGA